MIKHQDLEVFGKNLQYRLELLAKTRSHTDRLLATQFSVFEYIKPNENRLSDILRDLLNIRGTHGQGDIFLREFLDIVCASTMESQNFRSVHREMATSMIERNLRRMDVLIDFGFHGIAIENKPWAGDEEEQIEDYSKHLAKRFAGNFIIVYLSPDGSQPSNLDKAIGQCLLDEKKLLLVAYHGKFTHWLERCYQICKAEKVRWFLSDFIAYVGQQFPVTRVKPKENE